MDNSLLNLSDSSFPISIIEHDKTNYGSIFEAHLHQDHLQLFYFTNGIARITCSNISYSITSPSIFIVNPNQIHYGESNSSSLHYYVFRINLKLLSSYNISMFNEKYLLPLENNLIIFENIIDNTAISKLLAEIVKIYSLKESGYELALFSLTINILSELLTNHIKVSSNLKDVELLSKKTKRFAHVFEYINKNYNYPISLNKLSQIAHMSEGYFCRMFKTATGRTPMDYINRIRIEKSVLLLNQGICNITEAALSVGFDDINYFCRVFRKYMKQSPTEYIHNDRKYFI